MTNQTVQIVQPRALASTLFYALTNSMQYGSSATMRDAVNQAMNFGLSTVEQDRIGLTYELQQLNWPGKK